MEEDKIEYPKELRDRVKNIIDLDKSINYNRNLYSAVVRFSNKSVNESTNESIDEIAKSYHKNIKNVIENDIAKLKLLLYGRKEI